MTFSVEIPFKLLSFLYDVQKDIKTVLPRYSDMVKHLNVSPVGFVAQANEYPTKRENLFCLKPSNFAQRCSKCAKWEVKSAS